MNKRLQNDEFHFVSIKSLNLKSHSFRIFTSLIFLFYFCGAKTSLHAQQKNNSQPSRDTVTQTTSNPKAGVSSQEKLFSYPQSRFSKDTEDGLLTPEIHEEGGVFSYRRISPGNGALNINIRTGALALIACDAGIYEIFYKKNNEVQIFTLEVAK